MKKFFGVAGAIFVLGLMTICRAGGNPEDILALPGTHLVKPAQTPENQLPENKGPDNQKLDSQPSENQKKDRKNRSFAGPADWIYEASDWRLDLYIIGSEPGVRGSHGILIFEGKQIPGQLNEIRALPIGTVQYFGGAGDRTGPGQNSGWQMKDPLVKPKVTN